MPDQTNLMPIRPKLWTLELRVRYIEFVSRYQIEWPVADPFAEAFHSLRMTGLFYCRSELTAPWGLWMPPMPGSLWFHAVTAGRCTLAVDGTASITLAPGAFTLITQGTGHFLRTEKSAETPNVLDIPHEMVSERYALLRHGGGGEACTLICGVVRLDHHVAQDLLRVLPPVIHADAFSESQTEWMASALKLMAFEAREISTGGETVITRLADILVIQAIRSWLARDPAATTGWLGALQDRQVGRALALIHRQPEHAWTVASLAQNTGMSRSAFAMRFRALVGQSPLQYLTAVRLRIADQLLNADKRLTVGELAGKLGYQSEAAFHRVYKRKRGVSPGEARRAENRRT